MMRCTCALGGVEKLQALLHFFALAKALAKNANVPAMCVGFCLVFLCLPFEWACTICFFGYAKGFKATLSVLTIPVFIS